MQEFEKKVAVVTGGGTGIGAATAARLIESGAKVVINGRREGVLIETAKTLDPSGQRVAVVAGDIGKRATAKAVVEASKRFGPIDIVVNAAGIFAPKPFVEHDEATFDAYIDAILKGTFFMTLEAVSAMPNGGSIVNVGSMWALQAVGATPSSAYSAAKAGVHALTKNLALELAGQKIRVNTVAPAVVKTPVYETFLPKEQIPEVVASFTPMHPLGRVGETSDLVEAITFFASERAGWITGTILPVDGGVMAGRA